VTSLATKARRIVRWLWANFLATSGCLWWAKRHLHRNGAIATLTFHRVLPNAESKRTRSLPGIVLLEHTFRALLAHVVRRCEPVDLRNSEPGTPSRRLRVAFTFDDGWIDTYTVAFPIAFEYGVPFSVFVCPGLIDVDTPFWPEQLVALLRVLRPSARIEETELLVESLKRATPEQREQYMATLREQVLTLAQPVQSPSVDRTFSWAAVAEMACRGVSFGSHTLTHQILTKVSPKVARQEVHASKVAIESALCGKCEVFAYPNGDCSPEIRNILAESGFRLAVTTTRGAWTIDSDRLAIPRSNICEDNVTGLTGRFSAAMFEYTTFWTAWRAKRADVCWNSRAHQQPGPVTE
jgi:peptidoglycan/xylan/chitin deacetylase (PgdA/CDA1 family)